MEIRKIILTLLVVVLAACSSNQKIQTNKISKLNTENSVFALLKLTESGYDFTKFQSQISNKNLPWVNLKTGQPAWNTNTQRCGVGLIKDRNNKVSSCDAIVKEELFLESDFDEGDAALRVLGAAFTLGLTLTGASFDVEFNKEEWIKAYEEAYSKADITTLEKFGLDLSSLKSEYRSTSGVYSNAVKQAKDKIKFNFVDRSGLYASQTDFKNLVSLKANQLPQIPTLSGDSASNLANDLNDKKKTLVSDWLTLSSSVFVSCSSRQTNGFAVNLTCPESFKIIDNQATGEITVNILNRSYNRVFVNKYVASDENLKLTFKENRIGLSNNTDKFLSIDSIALYYLDKVAKNKNLDIELSPRTELTPQDELKLRNFPIEWGSLAYKNMTKKKAEDTGFKFGFAIKYRVIDSGVEKTIFSTETFSLLDLIDS